MCKESSELYWRANSAVNVSCVNAEARIRKPSIARGIEGSRRESARWRGGVDHHVQLKELDRICELLYELRDHSKGGSREGVEAAIWKVKGRIADIIGPPPVMTRPRRPPT